MEECVEFTVINSGIKVSTKNKFNKSPFDFIDYVNRNIGNNEVVKIGTIHFVGLREAFCEDGKELMLGISIPEFIELMAEGEVSLTAFSKEDVMELSQEMTSQTDVNMVN